MNPDKALDIIYDNELPLRVVFRQTPDDIIGFVNAHLRAHNDVDQIFFEFYKYSYLISARNSKMEYMKSATDLHNQFQKLLVHNQRCISGASVAFMDAMNDYKKYQQGSSAPESDLSWLDRKFGSHAQYVKMIKNVKNVTGVYLFMVAFTFALLQYELMFNAKCVALAELYKKNIANGNPAIVSVPATITMKYKDFYDVFVYGIGNWLKGEHSLGEYADNPTMIIPTFMAEIGTDGLLDKQFARTIDPGLQQRFQERQERQSQNLMDRRPMSSGGRRGRGHGHGSKRRNKRATTRARRMRRTNKRRSSF